MTVPHPSKMFPSHSSIHLHYLKWNEFSLMTTDSSSCGEGI